MADAQHTYVTLENLQQYHQKLIDYIDAKAASRSDIEEIYGGIFPLSNSYYLRYYDNFSDGLQTGLYLENRSIEIINNPFTRDNTYEFVSWNTAANGSGTTYYPGDFITLHSDVNLYAIWSVVA